jgi:EmrB/QacA subfamily drug resistance transporter
VASARSVAPEGPSRRQIEVVDVYQYDPTVASPGGEPEIREWLDLDAEVRSMDGNFVYAAGFYGAEAARSVSVHNGSTTVLDGVGAVAGEVAGLLVIDVPDLSHRPLRQRTGPPVGGVRHLIRRTKPIASVHNQQIWQGVIPLPYLTYTAPGDLPQDPGRGAESSTGAEPVEREPHHPHRTDRRLGRDKLVNSSTTSTSTTAPNVPEPLDRRILAIGGVIVLGAIMAMLDMTVINVALERLIVEFDTTLATMQWVATGYTLALATVIPLSGWAADRFGAKRVYLTAVFLFMAGSALAGTAWSAGSLILFRVLQGLGGGMLLPLSMTILTRAAGPARIGRVMAVLGIAMQLGPVLGPVLGGWLVDDVSWRSIFYLNVPVGVLTLILGARILPDDERRPAATLDVLGLLLLSPGLAALIYGLAQVPSHETFANPEVYLPAGVGAALVIAFLVHAARRPYALIDLKLFRSRGFSLATVTMALFIIAFFGTLLLFPLYFQQVRGESALTAGLLVAPQGVGVMLMMPIAGRLVDRGHAARLVPAGIVVIAAALAVFTRPSDGMSYWTVGAALFAMGLGMGMVGMPNMSIALKTLQPQDIARASTSLSIIQQVSASIGTAMLSVILFNEITDRLAPTPGQPPAPALRADAYAATFTWALVLLALSLIPALLRLRAGGVKKS